MSYGEAERFIEEKQQWLLHAVQSQKQRRGGLVAGSFQDGMLLPFFDSSYVLRLFLSSTRRRRRLLEEIGTLSVWASHPSLAKESVEQWYCDKARTYFVP
ncbi:MAG: hypothetical protein ACRD4B_08310, partial [Acidobacteriota bacterium]